MSSGGVVGLRAAPASQPAPRITSRILCRWVTASGCTEMLVTPASTNGWIRLSGLSTMRWASTGRSTASTRGGDDGTYGQVRHEVVVHCVEVDQLRAAFLRPANLLREVGEVRREYRGRANYPVAEITPERQTQCLPM